MQMIDPEMPLANRLKLYYAWARKGPYKIKDRHGHLVPFRMRPVQKRMYKAMLKQASEGKPVRIQVLKARKEGISTLIQTLGAFLTQWTPHWYTVSVAHTEDSTRDIHSIAKRLFTFCDQGPQPTNNSNPIEFAHDAGMSTRTAGGRYVMSSATVNFAHFSELPKWEGNVEDQLASLFGSVPKVPETMIFVEGTANMRDTSGEFQARWEAAIAGDSPFLPFFSPWFEDPDYRIKGGTIEDLDDEEKQLREEFQLDDEQLAWRRETLHADFHGNKIFFRQEYPATPDEAFQAPEGLIYPMLAGDRHDRQISVNFLLDNGYSIYRALDWGGADPFVCLWVAHKPGDPALTIDRMACPSTWWEHSRYAWKNRKPIDQDDHTCDALRYCQQEYGLEGHMHVFREIYEPNYAVRGESPLDMAVQVKMRSKDVPILDTVAGRDRPDSIRLFCNQGVPCCGVSVPKDVSARGEKIDGIFRIQALLVATLPMTYPAPRPAPFDVFIARQNEMGLSAGIPTIEGAVAMQRYELASSTDANPIFGAH